MAIDDPFDAFEQQYLGEESKLPKQIAKTFFEAGKLALPDGGWALDILLKVGAVLFDTESGQGRISEFFLLVRDEFRRVGKTTVNPQEMQRAICKAIWYDRLEQDDAKRARYIKVIGNILTSEEQINDAVSFIQTIEQLNERDLIVLRVINKIMNKKNDWQGQHQQVSAGPILKLHPSTLNARAQELTVNIALALGQKTERNTYNREEGYGICCRLQGFGLAHELELQPRELPLTNYAFRLSTQGIRLLHLLGEEVPNYAHYFKDY
jgi:hypothetical protein